MDPITPKMAAAITVACPTCTASPNVVCFRRGQWGDPLVNPHAARVERAAQTAVDAPRSPA